MNNNAFNHIKLVAKIIENIIGIHKNKRTIILADTDKPFLFL